MEKGVETCHSGHSREDQVALVAFPFAEGTEILEGARASLLEEPYLRFARAWSWAKRIGAEGIFRASRCHRQEPGGQEVLLAHTRAQGHTHAHSHAHPEAGMNGSLALAGLYQEKGLEHSKELL